MASNDTVYLEKTTSQKLASATGSSDLDAEKAGVVPERTLHRQLKNRHIAMIRCILSSTFFPFLIHTFVYSIGGVIGTGLFLGTANALEHGGPIGLLLGYSIVGTICYCVMVHSYHLYPTVAHL